MGAGSERRALRLAAQHAARRNRFPSLPDPPAPGASADGGRGLRARTAPAPGRYRGGALSWGGGGALPLRSSGRRPASCSRGCLPRNPLEMVPPCSSGETSRLLCLCSSLFPFSGSHLFIFLSKGVPLAEGQGHFMARKLR